MQTYLKSRPAWIQLIIFVSIAFGLFTVVSMIGMGIYAAATGTSIIEIADPAKWNYLDPRTIWMIRFMQTLQFLGLFLLPSLIFALPGVSQYLGLRLPHRNRYWIFGLTIMIIAIPLVEYTGLLNRQITFGPEIQRWIQTREDEANKMITFMLSRHTPGELFLNLIFIALTAGIGEELFFRGVMQRLFIKWFRSPWAGIIVTAIIFSAIHMQFLGFLPRFLMGILLGAIYWYSGSLLVAILAHFIYDALVITLVYLRPEMLKDTNAGMTPQANLWMVALGSAILVGTILWQMKRYSTTSFADIYKDDQPPKDEFRF
jgi:hypothetical protein